MAEIKMEKRRSSTGWVWLVVVLLVIVFGVWWIWAAADEETEAGNTGIEWRIEVPVEPPASVIAQAVPPARADGHRGVERA